MASMEIETNQSKRGMMADALKDDLLKADAEHFFILRDCLEFRKKEITPELWDTLKFSDNQSPKERFQAAVALALYDTESEDWDSIAPDVARYLTSLNQIEISHWIQSVKPIRTQLRPTLLSSFKNQKSGQEPTSERSAVVLARLFDNQPDWLIDAVLPFASPIQASHIVDALKNSKPEAIKLLKTKLADEIAHEKETPNAKHQANLVIALIQLDPEYRWNLFSLGDDPSLATELIERIGPCSTSFETLHHQLVRWADFDEDRLSGILLSIGQYPESNLNRVRNSALEPILIDIFSNHPSARVHSSARWLLAKLGMTELMRSTENELKRETPAPAMNWHVDMAGITFAIIGPVDAFQMGLDRNFPTSGFNYDGKYAERRHIKSIPRRFGISISEITTQQYEECETGLIKAFQELDLKIQGKISRLDAEDEKSVSDIKNLKTSSRRLQSKIDRILSAQKHRTREEMQLPITKLNYAQAVSFCCWLSKKHRLKHGFESRLPNRPTRTLSVEEIFLYPSRLIERPNLLETGYRLPTAAEWEYVARGQSKTLFPFGRDASNFVFYDWYSANAATEKPVGLLKPTCLLKPGPFGAFDMLGNSREWCLDFYIEGLPKLKGTATRYVDFGPEFEGHQSAEREIRGGSYNRQIFDTRPSIRTSLDPNYGDFDLGFRLARTYNTVVD